MAAGNVLQSFLCAAQGKGVFEQEEFQGGKASDSGGLTVDINTANQTMTNMPWFLAPSAA